jgi:hypothetical protein
MGAAFVLGGQWRRLGIDTTGSLVVDFWGAPRAAFRNRSSNT